MVALSCEVVICKVDCCFYLDCKNQLAVKATPNGQQFVL